MDLNSKEALLSCEPVKANNFGDTTLQLNFLSYGGNNTKGLENISCDPRFKLSDPSNDGCELVLGLGPTPSAYLNTYCNSNQEKGLTMVSLHSLASGCDSVLKLGLTGVTKDALSMLDSSTSVNNDGYVPMSGQVSNEDRRPVIPIVDEGSTSAKKSGGYMPSLLLAPNLDSFKLQTRELLELGTNPHCQQPQHSCELSATTEISMGSVSEQTTVTGASSEHRSSNFKKCKFAGCSRGARGASGLCIGHGGGQRCLKPGCNKGAESRTAYCKAHGGGRRCQHLGCTKSAEGKTEYCIAHGGGRRCGYHGGCTKAARGKSGLCIRHGGGKRCKIEGCTRSAEGQAGLCISHGGGRRCQYPECAKGAQGSTMFCKAHGGGKRCIFAGCTKGAEGSTPLCKGHGGGKRCLFDGGGICPKSVHGGTNFCVAHGGGKRCAVPGCTKSARGRTDCCVRHGGGKRCKFPNCGKSAQGSTDFCKAHGGGKRCTWPEARCEKFARGKSGLCAAHSSMAQERESNRRGLIAPGLFHGLVSAASTTMIGNSHSLLPKGVAASNGTTDPLDRPAKRQHLIPPQVLVPLSMKTSSSTSSTFLSPEKDGRNQYGVGNSNGGRKSLDSMVPEGRVHGGGLMSLLGGSLKNAVDKV